MSDSHPQNQGFTEQDVQDQDRKNLGRKAGAFIQEQASALANRASEKLEPMMEGARESVSNLAEKGATMLENARGGLSTLEQKTDDAIAAAGGQIRNVAGRLRESAPQGMLGSAAGAVANTLESGGTYLEEHDVRAMAKDVSGVIRTYPISSILLGIGLGFLLGRTFRR